MDHERRQLEALFVFLNSSCTLLSHLQSCDRLKSTLLNSQMHTPKHASRFSRDKSSGEQLRVSVHRKTSLLCFMEFSQLTLKYSLVFAQSDSFQIQRQRWELSSSLRQQRVQTTQNHSTGAKGSGARAPVRSKAIGHCLKTATCDYCSAVCP